MWFVLHPSCKILNRYATEKQEKKILKNKNDEDKVAEITTEGESEEATEQPNKSKENRKRNATINERDTHTHTETERWRKKKNAPEREKSSLQRKTKPSQQGMQNFFIHTSP
jgi:hypothetical protein